MKKPHIPTSKFKVTLLGEFWVDSDGEIFVDITDPLKALDDALKFDEIQKLQKRLAVKKTNTHKIATRYKRDTRLSRTSAKEAERDRKGY